MHVIVDLILGARATRNSKKSFVCVVHFFIVFLFILGGRAFRGLQVPSTALARLKAPSDIHYKNSARIVEASNHEVRRLLIRRPVWAHWLGWLTGRTSLTSWLADKRIEGIDVVVSQARRLEGSVDFKNKNRDLG